MTIDEEFQKLIPPLTDDEYRQLEENCIKEGIREAILVWDRGDDLVIVDGHNRYKIARENGLKWSHKVLPFKDRETVKAWIRCNQLGRRNLDKWQKFDVAKDLEEALKKEAAERKKGGQGGVLLKEKFPEAKDKQTRDKLGNRIGVSGKTYDKMKKIDSEATPQVKQAVRDGKLSINQAYNSTFPKVLDPEKKAKQEHEEYIEKVKSGEVVSIHEAQRDKTNQEILYDSFMVALYKPLTAVNGFGLMYQTKTIEQMGSKMPQELKENILFKLEHCIRILESVKEKIERSGK